MIKVNRSIIDLQYGDTGKGRVSAFYREEHDWFVRYSGGPNAGHTVYKDGVKYALHQLPAGALFGKKIALDTGMVLDLNILKKEIDSLPSPPDLYISSNVHVIQDSHIEKDSSGGNCGGSTKRGISYVYSDRADRSGVRVTEGLLFKHGIEATVYKGLPPFADEESVLFESAQGIMLDIDYGCYPYVTSSSVFPSSVHKIDHKVAVMKAYTSRVGAGPPNFPEEKWLSELGGEIGTTTGRHRKSYWLIADEIDYALSILQPDEIVVTKLDILQDVSEIKIYENGEARTIGDIHEYKKFLIARWPKIKWFSESPHGPLVSATGA